MTNNYRIYSGRANIGTKPLLCSIKGVVCILYANGPNLVFTKAYNWVSKTINVLQDENTFITHISVSRNGSQVAVASNNFVLIFDSFEDVLLQNQPKRIILDDTVHNVSWRGTDKSLLIAHGLNISEYSLNNDGWESRWTQRLSKKVELLSISHSGNMFVTVGENDSMPKLWSASSTYIWDFQYLVHYRKVSHIFWGNYCNGSEKVYTASSDNWLRVWSIYHNKSLFHKKPKEDDIKGNNLSPLGGKSLENSGKDQKKSTVFESGYFPIYAIDLDSIKSVDGKHGLSTPFSLLNKIVYSESGYSSIEETPKQGKRKNKSIDIIYSLLENGSVVEYKIKTRGENRPASAKRMHSNSHTIHNIIPGSLAKGRETNATNLSINNESYLMLTESNGRILLYKSQIKGDNIKSTSYDSSPELSDLALINVFDGHNHPIKSVFNNHYIGTDYLSQDPKVLMATIDSNYNIYIWGEAGSKSKLYFSSGIDQTLNNSKIEIEQIVFTPKRNEIIGISKNKFYLIKRCSDVLQNKEIDSLNKNENINSWKICGSELATKIPFHKAVVIFSSEQAKFCGNENSISKNDENYSIIFINVENSYENTTCWPLFTHECILVVESVDPSSVLFIGFDRDSSNKLVVASNYNIPESSKLLEIGSPLSCNQVLVVDEVDKKGILTESTNQNISFIRLPLQPKAVSNNNTEKGKSIYRNFSIQSVVESLEKIDSVSIFNNRALESAVIVRIDQELRVYIFSNQNGENEGKWKLVIVLNVPRNTQITSNPILTADECIVFSSGNKIVVIDPVLDFEDDLVDKADLKLNFKNLDELGIETLNSKNHNYENSEILVQIQEENHNKNIFDVINSRKQIFSCFDPKLLYALLNWQKVGLVQCLLTTLIEKTKTAVSKSKDDTTRIVSFNTSESDGNGSTNNIYIDQPVFPTSMLVGVSEPEDRVVLGGAFKSDFNSATQKSKLSINKGFETILDLNGSYNNDNFGFGNSELENHEISANLPNFIKSTLEIFGLTKADMEELSDLVLSFQIVKDKLELLDGFGKRYLLAAASRKICYQDLIWANISNNQPMIMESVQGVIEANVSNVWGKFHSWETIKALGIPLWLNDESVLLKTIEQVAKYEYIGNKNLYLASVFYMIFGRKAVVLQLWRVSQTHPEHDKMVKFLGNDFTEQRWKSSAAKNAFVLLSKLRYIESIMFFLLANRPLDAASVAISSLRDYMLALTICRCSSNNNNILLESLKVHILPRIHHFDDAWLLAAILLRIERYDLVPLVSIGRVDLIYTALGVDFDSSHHSSNNEKGENENNNGRKIKNDCIKDDGYDKTGELKIRDGVKVDKKVFFIPLIESLIKSKKISRCEYKVDETVVYLEDIWNELAKFGISEFIVSGNALMALVIVSSFESTMMQINSLKSIDFKSQSTGSFSNTISSGTLGGDMMGFSNFGGFSSNQNRGTGSGKIDQSIDPGANAFSSSMFGAFTGMGNTNNKRKNMDGSVVHSTQVVDNNKKKNSEEKKDWNISLNTKVLIGYKLAMLCNLYTKAQKSFACFSGCEGIKSDCECGKIDDRYKDFYEGISRILGLNEQNLVVSHFC
ncbi:hypothetical protein BB559_002946 [Furculomyces boomerangus]|uniref:RAVE complex protein Rav1 C-terminal domain-containing protein n=1 Tax=Furculomyces boomerangus TaxID=61424 RepID=A0A2T9YQK3_9FUNG|nr:hypothetical protein BB559_002946 [Furculomyces boomerangus]